MKHEPVSELFERLKNWLRDDLKDLPPANLASKALYDGDPSPLRGTRADGLLEVGRIVHAEMSAITEAARRGLAVRNARLYCTTFPCHMCTRHVIASGIDHVIYIEPYPKSLAKQLYKSRSGSTMMKTPIRMLSGSNRSWVSHRDGLSLCST
jgi:cytidine deaminase